LLAVPASFGPIYRLIVGEPWTYKDTQYYSAVHVVSGRGIFKR
jgi:hypothetical protein